MKNINMIKRSALLACSALLAVSLAACSQPAAPDAASTPDTAASDTTQIPNPWADCATLADAAALTGYDFTVPDSVDGYTDISITVLTDEQLTEVQAMPAFACARPPAAMTSAEITTSMRKAMPLMLTAAA